MCVGKMSFLNHWQTGNLSPSSQNSKLSTPPRIGFALPIEPIKKASNSIPFFDCVKPVYMGARSAGLLTFSLNYTSNGDIKSCKLSIVDIIILVVSVVMCLVLIFLNSLSFNIVADPRANIMLVGRRTVLLCGLSLTVIYIIFDVLNRNHLINIPKRIVKFDKEVQNPILKIALSNEMNSILIFQTNLRSAASEFTLIMRVKRNLSSSSY